MLEGASADTDWRCNGRNGHGRNGIVGKLKGLIAEMLRWIATMTETPAFSARHWDPFPAVKIARMLLMESVDLELVFRKLLNNGVARASEESVTERDKNNLEIV